MEITPEQITAWMQAQVEELSKRTGYAALSLDVRQLEEYKPNPEWSIFQGEEHIGNHPTYEAALKAINTPTP